MTPIQACSLIQEPGDHSGTLQECPWLDSKEAACNVGDAGLSPGSVRPPGEGNGYPLQYSCLENPHGQRSLVGYSPCGHKVRHD